jgi:beta-phosphoglucomutase
LTTIERPQPRDERDWLVVEETFVPARQGAQESVFTVGNGRFATRGTFEEGFPDATPATLAHGIFAPHPIANTELAVLPDWTALDVHLDGERFSLMSGNVLRYRRTLDLRCGLLSRQVTWRSPEGRTAELAFERFVSLADDHLAATRVRVTALDFDGSIEVHARLNARPEIDRLAHNEWADQTIADGLAGLGVRIRGMASQIGLAMRLRVPDAVVEKDAWNAHEQPALVARWRANAGQSATFEKTVVLMTSRDADDPLASAVAELRRHDADDFGALCARSEAAWAREWSLADVLIQGDGESQVAIRFSLYQLFISAPRTDDEVSIGAKGLTGFGYRGHVFWDTEAFMLPFFTHVRSGIARNLLSYRYHRLTGARRKAAENGLAGAQFPWESAESGLEVTPRWLPDSTGSTLVRIWTGDIAIHITAVIALAVLRYWRATGDDEFMVERGAQIVLEGARFWASRAEWNAEREAYEFTDVLGPDEYHEHVNNNAFTNHVAAAHLRAAVEVGQWLVRANRDRARDLLGDDVDAASELAGFTHVADRIHLQFERRNSVIEQFAGYFHLRRIDLDQYADRLHSMQYILGMAGVAETQVIKQPDVLMLAPILPEVLSHDELRANYGYYTARTDHSYGSSLGPAIHALIAARSGRVEEAYEHFLRAARVDLADIRGNTLHGVHCASAGALWQAVVFGFAGLTIDGDNVTTDPHLPSHWRRLAFRIVQRGRVIDVDLRPAERTPARSAVRGLIFDLDGVVTNTAESHYLAWQRLADEEGLPFDRQSNEALRGISRRQSLAIVLGARHVTPAEANEMMERKNRYYRELIANLTPADVLPGVLALIDEARKRGLRIALGSGSKNAGEVVRRLELTDRFDAIRDGNSVTAAKPAPDLFLAAAEALDLPPVSCVVFEDAADGIAAAQAAEMMTVGIGPPERVGEADVVLRDGLAGVELDAILDMLGEREAAA